MAAQNSGPSAPSTSTTRTMAGVSGSPPSASALAAGLDRYAASFEAGETPLLGHLVLYSVFDGRVKREDLERWFLELGLDSAFLPPPIRPVDAFEQVTGLRGVRRTYPLDGTRPVTNRPLTSGGRPKRRPTDGTAKEATLMVRHVRRNIRRDGTGEIVRHLVREVRDEENTTLSYDVHLGETVFVRDGSDGAGPGAGTLSVSPDHTAIQALDEAERAIVYAILDEIKDTYAERCVFFTADRLRTLIRGYVEHLGAVKVRATGGVYFVHRAHAETLGQLRELVGRMGEGGQLSRIPIPDQEEMREMIQTAFTTQAKDDLDRLARDIVAARADGAPEEAVQTLYRRFQQLKAATAQHAELLSTTLDDTEASLQLVNLQLASLLTNATSEVP